MSVDLQIAGIWTNVVTRRYFSVECLFVNLLSKYSIQMFGSVKLNKDTGMLYSGKTLILQIIPT